MKRGVGLFRPLFRNCRIGGMLLWERRFRKVRTCLPGGGITPTRFTLQDLPHGCIKKCKKYRSLGLYDKSNGCGANLTAERVIAGIFQWMIGVHPQQEKNLITPEQWKNAQYRQAQNT